MTRFPWLKRSRPSPDVSFRRSTDSLRASNLSKTSSVVITPPKTPRKPNPFTKVANLDFDRLRYHRVERVDKFSDKHYLIVADNIGSDNGPQLTEFERVAIRVKIGRTAYTEWLNEIQVYLLPNFQHNNILQFLFADKCYRTTFYKDPPLGRLLSDLDTRDEESFKENFPKLRLQVSEQQTDGQQLEAERPTQYEPQPGTSKQFMSQEQHEPSPGASKQVDPQPGTSKQVEPQPGTSKQADYEDDYDEEDDYFDEEDIPGQSYAILNVTPEVLASHPQSNSITSSAVSGGRFKIRPEYWVLTDYTDSMLLSDYLRLKLFTWNECLDVAHGIASGLHYLHENNEHQDIDTRRAIDKFIYSTHGALKKVSFVDNKSKMLMEPPILLSIIHRNLSPQNIVLMGPQKVAKICNFGQAYVQHPFQPINHSHVIDSEIKLSQLTNPYSPPEVLQEKGHLTLAAMKSIDMYACGVIFWELFSRTRLLVIRDHPKELQRLRLNPRPYKRPFEEELENCPSDLMSELLEFIVCEERVRPPIETEWQEGKYSLAFVQTIRDLWDQEFEARLHSTTVLDRISRLREATSTGYQDYRLPYKSTIESKRHDKGAWIDRYRAGPVVIDSEHNIRTVPNIRFEDVVLDRQ